jgi:aryl-alcohol dehydrogenase-like predicted oxidoreductase
VDRRRDPRAWHIADKHHLHKPVMEQPQYNLLARGRVEFEYARLYEDIGLGLTVWSPLARVCSPGSTSTAFPTAAGAHCPATNGCSSR